MARSYPEIAFIMKKGQGDPIGIEIRQGQLHFFGGLFQDSDPETNRQQELLPRQSPDGLCKDRMLGFHSHVF
jgi:hypothetical protein